MEHSNTTRITAGASLNHNVDREATATITTNMNVRDKFHYYAANPSEVGEELRLVGEKDCKLINVNLSPIYSMTSLTTLDLSCNMLTSLPDGLGALTGLRSLNLGSNAFERQPSGLDQLTNLTSLSLRLNAINKWPTSINNSGQIKTLDLGFNALDAIDFGRMRKIFGYATPLAFSLTNLDISYNLFTQVPSELLEMHQLAELNLSGNNLGVVSNDLAYLPLTVLRLADTSLTEFPPAVLDLDGLQVLDLSSNPIKRIPTMIRYLPMLAEVLLEKCGLDDITPLSLLPKVRRMVLSNNSITHVPADFEYMIFLEELLLNGNQLTEISEVFSRFTSLQTLDLSKNRISKIHRGLAKLTRLQRLNLEANDLESLASDLPLNASGGKDNANANDNNNNNNNNNNELIEQESASAESFIMFLTKLEELNLSSNKLTSLPDLSQLTAMRDLNASNNRLTSFPSGIESLGNLQRLDLSKNKIAKLPMGLYTLARLESLVLTQNYISEIDPQIVQLTALKALHLCKNELDSLPTELLALTKLNSNNNNNNSSSVNSKPLALEVLTIKNNGLSTENREAIERWAQINGIQLEAGCDHVDKVLAGLYISDENAASNRVMLKREGITHVLTMAMITPPHPDDFSYHVISVLDSKKTDLKAKFEEAFRFIDEGRKAGGCLVHCQAGVSRSATIVIAYLMYLRAKGGKFLSLRQAHRHVSNVRPIISPNPSFIKQLQEYEAELQKLLAENSSSGSNSTNNNTASTDTDTNNVDVDAGDPK